MTRTLFNEIWGANVAARRLDEPDLIYVDRHVLHEGWRGPGQRECLRQNQAFAL